MRLAGRRDGLQNLEKTPHFVHRCFGHNFERPPGAWRGICWRTERAGRAEWDAVSYTHLDVYKRQVEISYNGQTVLATVNDCGGMGGGSRSLGLQPGVWKAFGFSSCLDWGLRTVNYRFL